MRNCYWCKKNIHKEANTSNWSIEIRDSIAVANKAFSLDTIAFFYFLKRTKAKTQKSANTTIHSFQFACPWHASFYMLPAISVKFTEDTLQQFGMWNNLCWAKQMVTFPPPPSQLDFPNLIFRFLQVTEEYRGEMFSLIAWLVWNRHNALHLGKSVQPAQLLPS